MRASPDPPSAGERLLPSMADTLGPYYPATFARAFPPASTGITARLSGTIRDANGAPVPSAVLESWQADAGLFARHVVTDGRYAFAVILPVPGVRSRAPHVTLTLFCDGIARLVTQIFFAGEALNANDPVLASVPARLRTRLIARRGAGDGVGYERDIVLRGAGETPFFDDLTV